jgi:hypothetical protein
MYSCKRCVKVYRDFGSLYRHSVKYHHERCSRSGDSFQIPEDCLQDYLSRICRSQENSRQRRARQLREAQFDQLFDCSDLQDSGRVLSVRQSFEARSDDLSQLSSNQSAISSSVAYGDIKRNKREQTRSPSLSHKRFPSMSSSVRNASAPQQMASAPSIDNASAPRKTASGPCVSNASATWQFTSPSRVNNASEIWQTVSTMSVGNASASEETVSIPNATAFQEDCEFMIDLFPNAFESEEARRPSSSFVPWPVAYPSTSVAATLDNGFQTNIGSSEELSLFKLSDAVDVGSLVSLDDCRVVHMGKKKTKFFFHASHHPNLFSYVRNRKVSFIFNINSSLGYAQGK